MPYAEVFYSANNFNIYREKKGEKEALKEALKEEIYEGLRNRQRSIRFKAQLGDTPSRQSSFKSHRTSSPYMVTTI